MCHPKDFYHGYQTRTELLDHNLEILPGEWQMDFNGIKVIGIPHPIIEVFDLVDNKIYSRALGVGSSIFQFSTVMDYNESKLSTAMQFELEKRQIEKSIYDFFYDAVHNTCEGPQYIADGILVYSLQRIILPQGPHFTTIVKYQLRWTRNKKIKNVRKIRDEKINQILFPGHELSSQEIYPRYESINSFFSPT